MLTIFEELLLLTIHEEKGTYLGSTGDRIRPGLVGAMLCELALMNKIQTTDNHRLHILDGGDTGDELLNEVLNSLKESEKERKFGTWISALVQKPEKFRKQITERLVQKGILVQEDDHVVWVTPTPLHPETNASTKYWLIRHLRGIVLAQLEVRQRELALLSMIRACDFLDLVFLRDERRYASRHINELLVSGAIKDALAQTLQEIEHAIAVVVEDD